MTATASGTSGRSTVIAAFRTMIGAFDRFPYSLAALATRFFPAVIFWRSGQTKVEGLAVTDTARYLFREEYQVPLLDPAFAASLAAIAEHVFPVLLVLGLATRFSALGLLLMTAVIQIFVYPDAWPTHGLWAACFLVLISQGPGRISLDHLIDRASR